MPIKPPYNPGNFENKGKLTPTPRIPPRRGEIPPPILESLREFLTTPTDEVTTPIIERNLSSRGKKSSESSPLPTSSGRETSFASPTSKSASPLLSQGNESLKASPSKSARESSEPPPAIAHDEALRTLLSEIGATVFSPITSSTDRSFAPPNSPVPQEFIFYSHVDSEGNTSSSSSDSD